MTQPIAVLDGPFWPYLALILFAVLPTEIWRWLAVGFAAAAVMLFDKRRMMLAMLAGETILIGGVWLLAG
ncbi:MAG: hypothetical protein EOP23_03100 [Hyphomicrobiales bacterium]|nr:MAG: hypothetical protein EOP23_03100 [Hyphomicrobiales bacterium]